ncbi:MAG: aerial mycelium formation protein [Actinomycetes bacterium]
MTPDSPSGTRGNRRIDRVLGDDFLTGLPGLSIDDLRALRADAEQEEADVSYVRRLLQGRIDIINAELERRRGGSGASLVDALPRILADDRGEPHGLGQHRTVEPSRVDQHRRRVEALVADVDISNVTAHGDADLTKALETLAAEERDTSETRRRIQVVVDACAAEITRRYREGEAAVDDLLPSESGN